MTTHSDDMTVEEKVVIFFDICSSSMILEDLLTTGNLEALRNLMISLKSFLRAQSTQLEFVPYKFVGDGWVLLFPINVSGTALIKFMTELSDHFARKFRKHIGRKLQHTPEVVGLTFGVDKGPLIKILMNQQDEYIGRSLNVASRLQGAIKDDDDDPAYKVLISKHAFYYLKISEDLCKVERARRQLRNISNNAKLEYKKLTLPVSKK
jgi:hypothetical protein